ncbi:MAG: DUF3106 domain-containing protein [Pseudoxanthomonas suwonensis]|nr:DUF3106 domain-containing protein [Pseudoxanthomonas suwonensis]
MQRLVRAALLGTLWLGLAAGAHAQSQAPGANLPAWEQLTPAQRETLLAPLRGRWNDASPGQRRHMLQRAQRWNTLPSEQRQRAERGMRHWDSMPPQQRREMRALYQHMRSLDREQRNALRERWRTMTAEQRRAWVDAHPPKND